jgi:hypothetical protein
MFANKWIKNQIRVLDPFSLELQQALDDTCAEEVLARWGGRPLIHDNGWNHNPTHSEGGRGTNHLPCWRLIRKKKVLLEELEEEGLCMRYLWLHADLTQAFIHGWSWLSRVLEGATL